MCMRSSHTETVGDGNSGSAKAPTGIPSTSGVDVFVKKTVAPHSGQKWNVACLSLSSERRVYCCEVPVMWTWSRSKRD